MQSQISDNKIRYSQQYRQIRQMVEAQMGLNKQAYSLQWLEFGSKPEKDEEVWDYPLAATQEIAEFLNSWGYAWWSTKNWPIAAPLEPQNCMTELVDAWHFILSQALIEEVGDIGRAASRLLDGYAFCCDHGVGTGHRYVVREAKKLMSMMADWNDGPYFTVDIYAQFFHVLTAAGYSLDHFTARYNAKLQLNIFRQLNGYKDKPRTYVKVWENGHNGVGTKEDNDILSDHIDSIFANKEKMPSEFELMQWIAAQYSRYTGNKSVVPAQVEKDEE